MHKPSKSIYEVDDFALLTSETVAQLHVLDRELKRLHIQIRKEKWLR